jgi:hypothetical protein
MNISAKANVTDLTVEEQRDIDGGVMDGGCIDPTIQKILDMLKNPGSGPFLP